MTPQREIIQIKKNTGQLFFNAESKYEISKPYPKLVMDGHTHGSKGGQAQSNMPLQLFQSLGQSTFFNRRIIINADKVKLNCRKLVILFMHI